MNITILVVAYERAVFFCRAATGWKGRHEITFITTRYDIYKHIRSKGLKVYMLQDFIDEDIEISEFTEFKDDAVLMERKTGFLTESMLNKQFRWLCQGFKNYFSQKAVDKLLIWNGSMLQEYLASKIADSFHIKKLFFEIGNFPDKIFMDPKGVNARSSLMDKDLSICENFDEKRLMEFLEKHKTLKESNHIVPQAKLSKRINYSAVYEIVHNIFSKYPIQLIDLRTELSRRFSMSRSRYGYDKIDIEEKNYILFPLQVSFDSQVIRNSDITIETGIDYALHNAIENGLDLLIKPHPAEKNKGIIAYIIELKKKHGNLYLTNQNTYQLIKHSRKVMTINSTVGIEGLMYDKHVEVLGRALYKPYCEPDLPKQIDIDRTHHFLYNYLFNCLVNGDYFGKGELQIEIS